MAEALGRHKSDRPIAIGNGEMADSKGRSPPSPQRGQKGGGKVAGSPRYGHECPHTPRKGGPNAGAGTSNSRARRSRPPVAPSPVQDACSGNREVGGDDKGEGRARRIPEDQKCFRTRCDFRREVASGLAVGARRNSPRSHSRNCGGRSCARRLGGGHRPSHQTKRGSTPAQGIE